MMLFLCLFNSPLCPDSIAWSEYFPVHCKEPIENINNGDGHPPKYQVEFADIGCGYGGLIGMEILLLHSVHFK